MPTPRPDVTVVLAMSADGKITDSQHSPARFGSKTDKAHLEKQIAIADAVLFGANTLRAYGTTLTVTDSNLLEHRKNLGKDSQPLHIVITEKANINPEIRFFKQPVCRWLLTTDEGATYWRHRSEFEQILVFKDNLKSSQTKINLVAALEYFATIGIEKLAVLGGGQLVTSMLEQNLIDELWLTVCPLLLGGTNAPSAVAGAGFTEKMAPRLKLLEVKQAEQEVFLHYRVIKSEN
ncbi:bifunctional deaminase-reductase-like [Rivularia sp. IAM M-261]|nr:bifunctional deaminase-reductase-like [Calothrix sp. PCC 7716]GJD18912.1 bifunctional deaminase-reductase-like [Rivularia sp. IAM M-261]